MRPTLLTSKPWAGLPLKSYPTTSACHDLEEDDSVMFNSVGYRDQCNGSSFYMPKLTIASVDSSPSSNSTTWNDGNDFGDSPRDLLFAKLDGSPVEFSFSDNLHASANEAEGVCSTGAGSMVNDTAEVSDESPGEGKNRRRRRKRRAVAAAAAAAATPSAAESETMILRGEHQGDEASPDRVERLPASAGADAGEGRPVWPEDATTVMLRNIPNRYISEELHTDIMEEGFKGQIDFFYLPIDFATKKNRGYAFINFRAPRMARKFAVVFDDRRLMRYASKKVLHVTAAAAQGIDAYVKAFARRDARRIVNPWFRPMFFDRGADNGDVEAVIEASRSECNVKLDLGASHFVC
eukprot:TRINITY_DN9577_c0_g2_i4.p1 TRINITY_DN9577_c0_g2~~TRINITY_DN9577_c0_g2_i4.p1  ORF type:complete len:351 (+),score=61.82 TRINITY_DN9577_c0_g2_i4:82-1134(+)